MQLRNEETRSCEGFNKLKLSALPTHTRHQAAKSSPRWPTPVLEFRASLDENFLGLESPLEVIISVSNLPLYNLFVSEKKKSCHFGMNIAFSPSSET